MRALAYVIIYVSFAEMSSISYTCMMDDGWPSLIVVLVAADSRTTRTAYLWCCSLSHHNFVTTVL